MTTLSGSRVMRSVTALYRSVASTSSGRASLPLFQFYVSPQHQLPRFASSLYATSPSLPNQPPVVISDPVGPHIPDHQNPALRATPGPPPAKPARRAARLRPSKAALSLTPSAVLRLRNLISGPTPQLIRIGVRNKGCVGMAYHLEYVEKPGKFDEIVEQDGVQVLIDSKALFSIIGSEMDWHEDRMSSKFVFKNPNVVDTCGCGESFNVAST